MSAVNGAIRIDLSEGNVRRVERFVKAQERQADALWAIAKALGAIADKPDNGTQIRLVVEQDNGSGFQQ